MLTLSVVSYINMHGERWGMDTVYYMLEMQHYG